eukprot:scaffold22585_cov149-Cylindrotheca_fusiformis.AAC.6
MHSDSDGVVEENEDGKKNPDMMNTRDDVVVEENEDDDDRSFQYEGIPEDDAWLLSRLLFFWENPLFKRAAVLFKRHEGLQQEDLLPLPDRDLGDAIGKKFEEAWDAEDIPIQGSGKKLGNDDDIDAGSPKLRKAIAHILGWRFVFAGFVKAGKFLVVTERRTDVCQESNACLHLKFETLQSTLDCNLPFQSC